MGTDTALSCYIAIPPSLLSITLLHITLHYSTLHFLTFSTVTLQCIKLLDFAFPAIRCKTQAEHKQESKNTNLKQRMQDKRTNMTNKHVQYKTQPNLRNSFNSCNSLELMHLFSYFGAYSVSTTHVLRHPCFS